MQSTYVPNGEGVVVDLLMKEYQEINANLRANVTQFVNWFSFFMTISFIALGALVAVATYQPGLRSFPLMYVVEIVFLLLHLS